MASNIDRGWEPETGKEGRGCTIEAWEGDVEEGEVIVGAGVGTFVGDKEEFSRRGEGDPIAG